MSVSPTAGWSAAYTRYTSGAILLHWTIALAILFQLAVGLAMVHLDAMPDALRFALFQWHKTIGILVLCLTLARIAWRLVNPPPALAPTTSRAERTASGLVHLAFYALMLIVPLSERSSPAIMRSSVDFPQPDGPTKTTNSPLCAASETPRMTSVAPKDL